MLGGVCASSLVCEIDSDVSSSSDDDDDLKDQRAVSREDQVVPALPPDVPDWAIDEVVLEIWTSGVDVGGSRAAAPCIIWLQLAALSAIALQTSVYTLSRGQSSCVDGQVQMEPNMHPRAYAPTSRNPLARSTCVFVLGV